MALMKVSSLLAALSATEVLTGGVTLLFNSFSSAAPKLLLPGPPSVPASLDCACEPWSEGLGGGNGFSRGCLTAAGRL